MQNLEDEIAGVIAAEIAKEIDAGILYDIFVSTGYYPVVLESLESNKHAVDLKLWCDEHCMDSYFNVGRKFAFKNEKDALLFILSWNS